MVSDIALLGADFQKLRPSIKVAVGDKVAVGQTLFTDRHNDEICFVSPIAGKVKAIERGAHRSLSRLVVSKAGKSNKNPVVQLAKPSAEHNSIRDAMLASGLWPALVSRPFGILPNPADTAAAIFVNAVQRTADAPDPTQIIADMHEEFKLGLDRLTLLCSGSVFLCQSAPEPIITSKHSRVQVARFSGSYAARLSGTHIHRLAPQITEDVWCINYQDVIALGHLAASGGVPQTRIVAIAGSQAEQRYLCRAPLGSNLRDLTTGKFAEQAQKLNTAVMSGDLISGNPSTHLSRFDQLVSVEVGRHIGKFRSVREIPRPIIPIASLVDALPFGVPALPIMRALSVSDFERAKSLECTTMIEEDVASLNTLCASDSDYRPLLRRYLDHIQEALG